MDLQEQYNRLLRYCYMKTEDRFLAEDITQEAFLRFWQSRSYRDTGKELAYLYTIARNLCIDEFRRPAAEDIDEHGEIADGSASAVPFEDRIVLEQALEKLPDELREMVVLRYVSGLSDAEIGELFSISRFAVHRRIREGLNILKDLIGEERNG